MKLEFAYGDQTIVINADLSVKEDMDAVLKAFNEVIGVLSQ